MELVWQMGSGGEQMVTQILVTDAFQVRGGDDDDPSPPEIAIARRRLSDLPTPTTTATATLPLMTTTERFPPFITAQLNYLFHHFPFPLKMEQAWSGSKNYPSIFDRFTFCIPYRLGFIKWDVIYNAEFPLCPPDFIFSAEDESFRPFRVMASIFGGDNVSDWNFKEPSKLCSLMQELRDEYALYQWRRFGEVDVDRLKFEISTILSREVVYHVFRKHSSAPSAPRLKLVSTPELKALFSVDDVKLPSWVDGMCMADYHPYLEQCLHGHIMEAVSSIDVRRRFIEALGAIFEGQ